MSILLFPLKQVKTQTGQVQAFSQRVKEDLKCNLKKMNL